MASTNWSTFGTPTNVHRHQSGAIECFLLLAFLAYSIFHAFFALNLKLKCASIAVLHQERIIEARDSAMLAT